MECLGVQAMLLQSCLTLVTPWTVARQAPLSTGFSRQQYWSGFHFLLQGLFPTQGIKPGSPALAGGFFTPSATWKALDGVHVLKR